MPHAGRPPESLDYVEKLRREIRRLKRENERLRSGDCRACNGVGAVSGFLLGSVKTCPVCRGSGLRGRR